MTEKIIVVCVLFLVAILIHLTRTSKTQYVPSEKKQALLRLEKLAKLLSYERPDLFRKEGVVYRRGKMHVWWNRKSRRLMRIKGIPRELWLGDDGVIYRRIYFEDDHGNVNIWWEAATIHKRNVQGIERLEKALKRALDGEMRILL